MSSFQAFYLYLFLSRQTRVPHFSRFCLLFSKIFSFLIFQSSEIFLFSIFANFGNFFEILVLFVRQDSLNSNSFRFNCFFVFKDQYFHFCFSFFMFWPKSACMQASSLSPSFRNILPFHVFKTLISWLFSYFLEKMKKFKNFIDTKQEN